MSVVNLNNSAPIKVFGAGGEGGNFVVNFTKENNTYVADASYSSIIEAEESKHIIGVLDLSDGLVGVEKEGFTYNGNGNFVRLTLSEAGAVLYMQQITVGSDDFVEYYAGTCSMTPIFNPGNPA